MQSGFSLNDDSNLNESNMWSNTVAADEVDYFIEGGDYMSDTMQREIGVFHDPINTGYGHSEEYCGNFTFR